VPFCFHDLEGPRLHRIKRAGVSMKVFQLLGTAKGDDLNKKVCLFRKNCMRNKKSPAKFEGEKRRIIRNVKRLNFIPYFLLKISGTIFNFACVLIFHAMD